MKGISILSTGLILSAILFSNCNTPETKQTPKATKPVVERPARKEPKNVTYHFEKAKGWLKKADSTGLTALQKDIVIAVNRTDQANFASLDSILVPDDLTGDLEYYMNFPLKIASLTDVNKILLFSYPSQTFAAYENGYLVYSGPTNMGRKADPTPTGLYFTNWKAEQTTSTFNDEWDLKWNFNIENKEGIGFHQYALPGYPASHSCLRLQEKDAKYLYSWADQWKIKGTDEVLAKGTPVIVFGAYPFGQSKPWLQLVANPKALDMQESQAEAVIAPYIENIKKEQATRDSIGGA